MQRIVHRVRARPDLDNAAAVRRHFVHGLLEGDVVAGSLIYFHALHVTCACKSSQAFQGDRLRSGKESAVGRSCPSPVGSEEIGVPSATPDWLFASRARTRWSRWPGAGSATRPPPCQDRV